MQRQTTPMVAGRRRQAVTLSRVAAWLGFGGAVLSQAAVLAGCYFLAGDASPGVPQNAVLAGRVGGRSVRSISGACRFDWLVSLLPTSSANASAQPPDLPATGSFAARH